MSRKDKRIATDGGSGLSVDNPFAGLNLPEAPLAPAPRVEPPEPSRPPRRDTLLLRRLKSGRGGKVVTEVSGFTGNPQDLDRLLKDMQTRLGTGGTRKQMVLELQGECRERVRDLLTGMGYRVKGA